MKDYYTTGEVAKLCNIAIRTVQMYCERGIFEVKKSPVTGHRRISRQSVLKFMKSHGIAEELLSELERKSIIIADDDKHFAKILSSAITSSIPGCAVSTAGDGYTALIDISSTKPDIVVLDIRMPKIDGIELCRRLKDNSRTKRIKIVAVTAYDKEGYAEQIVAAGAVKCFIKPIKLRELVEFLRNLL